MEVLWFVCFKVLNTLLRCLKSDKSQNSQQCWGILANSYDIIEDTCDMMGDIMTLDDILWHYTWHCDMMRDIVTLYMILKHYTWYIHYTWYRNIMRDIVTPYMILWHHTRNCDIIMLLWHDAWNCDMMHKFCDIIHDIVT